MRQVKWIGSGIRSRWRLTPLVTFSRTPGTGPTRVSWPLIPPLGPGSGNIGPRSPASTRFTGTATSSVPAPQSPNWLPKIVWRTKPSHPKCSPRMQSLGDCDRFLHPQSTPRRYLHPRIFGRLLFGMVRASDQGTAFTDSETQSQSPLLPPGKLLGCHPAVDRQMLRRGPQVLTQSQNIHPLLRQIRQSLLDLRLFFPIPSIKPVLVTKPLALARLNTSRLLSYCACTRTGFCSLLTVSML